MRKSTEDKLIKAAKAALTWSGLREITTKKQEANGTSAWRCDKSGYEFSEYQSGYVRRQNVPKTYPVEYTTMYQINPRHETVNKLPSELVILKGRIRRIEEKTEVTRDFEMIEDKHSRLLYILSFYLRNKKRLIGKN